MPLSYGETGQSPLEPVTLLLCADQSSRGTQPRPDLRRPL